jgi:hypothetical protein
MTTLDEARAIARGYSPLLPTVVHLQALDRHCDLLARLVALYVDEQYRESADREHQAITQEIRLMQKASA